MKKDARKRGGRGVVLRWLVVVLIGAGLVVTGTRARPVDVDVVQVYRGPMEVHVVEEGKTRIRNRYVVYSPVAGALERIKLRAGDQVEKGRTVLATVGSDWSQFLNPRARAEAEMRVKAAESARLRSSEASEKVRTSLEFAVREKERVGQLFQKGSISRREWDQASNQVEVLERELRVAEFTAQVAEFEYGQARMALRPPEGGDKLQKIEGEVDVHQIVAPISGVVLKVYEESARPVTLGMPLMEVGDASDLEAEIELLSSDAASVRVGASVRMENWGGSQEWGGKVVMVEPSGFTKVSALGVEEQRVLVRVALDPLKEGAGIVGDRYRVEGRIQVWGATDVLLVPAGALFRMGKDWHVFVAKGNLVQKVRVELGHHNGIVAEVLRGLSVGDDVVVHAPDALREGGEIRRKMTSKP